MKLIAPTGHKSITLSAGETQTIFLQDLDEGSRQFHLEVNLTGENSTCHIIGRVSTQDKDQKQWTITQTFSGVNNSGSIDVHAIGEDQSQITVDASGVLEQSSQDANAHIKEKVILFQEAKARALPVLTVKTDRVQSASHAASVAPVDPDLLLYCASRGIKEKDAIALIKEGFLALPEV